VPRAVGRAVSRLLFFIFLPEFAQHSSTPNEFPIRIQGQNGSSPIDETAALFGMADCCLTSAPELLLSCRVLEPLFCGALSVCRWREAEPLRAAIHFICHVVGPPLPSWSSEEMQVRRLYFGCFIQRLYTYKKCRASHRGINIGV
jgi:hypothetical protein